MDNKAFRIVQVNLGRGRTASDKVINLSARIKAPILFIQEPYSYRNKVSGLGKYTNQILSGNKSDKQPWACIVVIDKDYAATLLGHISTSHCECAHIEGPFGGFFVVSVYLQYSLGAEIILQQLHNALRSIGNRRVIIGMDANGISPLWSFGKDIEADERGEHVKDFLSQWDLVTLNKPGNLCTFRSGTRNIDVTIADTPTALKLSDWRVLDELVSSDHRAIMITLEKLQVGDRFIGEKSQMFLLKDYVVANAGNVKKFAVEVTTLLQEASKSSIRRKRVFQKSVPWWNSELTAKKRQVNSLRRDYQKEREYVVREERKVRLLRPELKLG